MVDLVLIVLILAVMATVPFYWALWYLYNKKFDKKMDDLSRNM